MHELTVTRLRCGLCGADLPVMGRAITFRCKTCRATWIATGDGLRELPVLRVERPAERRDEPLWLPMWAVEIDAERLRASFSGLVADQRDRQVAVAGADPALARMTLPPAAELERVVRTISGPEGCRVYVPAFESPVERARLSVGRLMTLRRPALRLERSDGTGPEVPCVVGAEDAAVLCRYILIAVMPESIRSCAGLIDGLAVETAGPPRLIEIPFAAHGAALECLAADFHISARLVAHRAAAATSG